MKRPLPLLLLALVLTPGLALADATVPALELVTNSGDGKTC